MSPAEAPLWLGLLLVAAGGALGGALRFAVSGWVGRRIGETFPWGTLTVNSSGAGLLGVLAGSGLDAASGWPWTLFAVGLLGSYTTVSSLSLQTLLLVREGDHRVALGYVAGSMGVGLAAVWLGFALGAGLR